MTKKAAFIKMIELANKVQIADFWVGKGDLVMIAGPCVIESAELTLAIARTLKGYAAELNLPLIFKASFDKANRTSLSSFRGPGLKTGLEILARVKDEVGLPVLSDVHQVADVEPAARILDVLQIPAFLCRWVVSWEDSRTTSSGFDILFVIRKPPCIFWISCG